MSAFDQWETVAAAIDSWRALHPVEWNAFVSAMTDRRAQLRDKKYATVGDGSGLGRLLISFPPAVQRKNRAGKVVWDDIPKLIENVIPDFFEQSEKGKKLRAEFAKNFHDFRVGENA